MHTSCAFTGKSLEAKAQSKSEPDTASQRILCARNLFKQTSVSHSVCPLHKLIKMFSRTNSS